MCGILAILGLVDAKNWRQKAIAASKKQRHRGPDHTGIWMDDENILVHERLSIVDPLKGDQPFVSKQEGLVSIVNGEIYNQVELREKLGEKNYDFQSKSDCEPLQYLYAKYGMDFLNKVSVVGMFGFIIFDQKKNRFMAARDPFGIDPLYIGWGKDGSIWIASEMKAIQDYCPKFQYFPPGHYYDSEKDDFVLWYQRKWATDPTHLASTKLDLKELRQQLERATISHLMSDTPYGVLLSGGLDSSLVASIACHYLKTKGRKLHSFCIGLEGSPDLAASKKVANLIGTVHHELTFTVEEGLDAYREVIYQLETFDVTTVRAATPMFLMARKIKALGFKMVLTGEGSDEIFGGYLYFHKAPNKKELYEETVRKVKELHLFDCLRANKSMLSWGVETRVPFLDTKFVDYAMEIDPQEKLSGKAGKGRIEKYILRKAFDCDAPDGKPYLPKEVLWRQKEQFSDGVGYSWINSIKRYANEQISDQQMTRAKRRFPIMTPMTKEAYLVRDIFTQHYPSRAAVETVNYGESVACSTAAAIKWDESFSKFADPSGRAVKAVHSEGYGELTTHDSFIETEVNY